MTMETRFPGHVAVVAGSVAAIVLGLVVLAGKGGPTVRRIDSESAAAIQILEELSKISHPEFRDPAWFKGGLKYEDGGQLWLRMPRLADDEAVRFVVEHYRKLVALDIQHSSVTDASLEALATVEPLRLLILGDSSVTDAGVRHFQSRRPNCVVRRFPPRIAYFLESPAMFNEPPHEPQRMDLAGLAHVEIHRTATADDIELLAKFCEVEAVFADELPLSDRSLASLAKLPRLRMLVLASATGITEWGLQRLHGHPELRRLRCESPGVTSAALEDLKKAIPACRVLTNWTGDEIYGFRYGWQWEHYKRDAAPASTQEQEIVERLKSAGTTWLVDDSGSVRVVAGDFTVIDNSRAAAIGRLSALEELALGRRRARNWSAGFTVAGLREMIRSPSLKYLSLAGGLDNIPKTIEAIAEVKSLRYVYFHECDLTDSNLARLRELRPDLLVKFMPPY